MKHAILLAALGCAPALGAHPAASDALQYGAGVRISTLCADGTSHQGSGVAITSRHVITATHVVSCGGVGPFLVLASTRAGRGSEMVVDLVASGADVARLVAEGTRRPFRSWAEVTQRPPVTGERVCVVAASGGHHLIRRCGDADVIDGQLLVAVPGLPGNSGGGVFDAAGRVVGVIRQGRADYSSAVPSRAWRAVVVREVPELMGEW